MIKVECVVVKFNFDYKKAAELPENSTASKVALGGKGYGSMYAFGIGRSAARPKFATANPLVVWLRYQTPPR